MRQPMFVALFLTATQCNVHVPIAQCDYVCSTNSVRHGQRCKTYVTELEFEETNAIAQLEPQTTDTTLLDELLGGFPQGLVTLVMGGLSREERPWRAKLSFQAQAGKRL